MPTIRRRRSAFSWPPGAERRFRRAIAEDTTGWRWRTSRCSHAAGAHQSNRLRPRLRPPGRDVLAIHSLPYREKSHVNALATVIVCGSGVGLCPPTGHLAAIPRDAMVLAPCTCVFGLIGFIVCRTRSGACCVPPPGSFAEPPMAMTGCSASAHALCRRVSRCARVERALPPSALLARPPQCHGAHIRSHITTERRAGSWPRYLRDGWRAIPMIACCIPPSWHVALWDSNSAVRRQPSNCAGAPGCPAYPTGPPINTKHAERLGLVPFRAEMGRRAARIRRFWQAISEVPPPSVSSVARQGLSDCTRRWLTPWPATRPLALIIASPEGPPGAECGPLARVLRCLQTGDLTGAVCRACRDFGGPHYASSVRRGSARWSSTALSCSGCRSLRPTTLPAPADLVGLTRSPRATARSGQRPLRPSRRVQSTTGDLIFVTVKRATNCRFAYRRPQYRGPWAQSCS